MGIVYTLNSKHRSCQSPSCPVKWKARFFLGFPQSLQKLVPHLDYAMTTSFYRCFPIHHPAIRHCIVQVTDSVVKRFTMVEVPVCADFVTGE